MIDGALALAALVLIMIIASDINSEPPDKKEDPFRMDRWRDGESAEFDED